MKRRQLLWWTLAGPLAVLIALLAVAHPYLAFTEKSGGDVLVVEGWMEDADLEQAAALYREGGYRRAYTTGTVRPFAYYLCVGEAVGVASTWPKDAVVRLLVSGTTGAGFTLTSGDDTLLHTTVEPEAGLFHCTLPRAVDGLAIHSWNSRPSDRSTRNIFIQSLHVDGENAHYLGEYTYLQNADGSRKMGWPTYAHWAHAQLLALGLPWEQVHALPAWGHPKSRSWANANHFAVEAHAQGITAADVVTVGVHARRTRNLTRKACGPEVRVGVISLPDPYCLPGDWWRSSRGRWTLLKELFGVTGTQAIEITR